MTPYEFKEDSGIQRATAALQDQNALSAVIYAGTSVGLEAVLGGLPMIRFQPADSMVADVMPESLHIPAATPAMLATMLGNLAKPEGEDINSVFSRPDMDVWRNALNGAS